ncbi:MAG: hypothetical protein ACREIU_05695, partial [Planctomycetota bacterium]
LGQPVADAYVVLGVDVGGFDEDGVAFEPAFESVDSTRTDPEGGYSPSLKRAGSGVVRVEAKRFEPASERVEVPDLSARQRIDFQLVPLPISVIRGRLATPDGRPLSRWEVATLFPAADPGFERILGGIPQGVSWIYALTDPYCPWVGQGGVRGEAAVIRPETSSFEIEVPRHAERVVTAIASSQVLAEEGWRDGDSEVLLVVDVATRFLRGLDVQVLDARTDAPLDVAGAGVTLRIPGSAGDVAWSGRRTGRGSFSCLGREGVYDLEARAPGYASAVARVELGGRLPRSVRVPLHAPATAHLLLDAVDGWLPEPGSRRVRYRDARGLEVRTGLD